MMSIYTESFLTACCQRLKSDIHGVVVELNSEPEENSKVYFCIYTMYMYIVHVHVHNMFLYLKYLLCMTCINISSLFVTTLYPI